MTNKLKYFVANWKMYGNLGSLNSLGKVINFKKKNKNAKNLKIIYCPPFTLLHAFVQKFKNSNIKTGAQNCSFISSFGPPTGSISYINNSTSSIHPIVSKIEIRKEGKIGRVYYPAAYMTNDNQEYYQDAYEIGPEKIIDTYAAATQHVDQGLSLTLFFPDTATTRDINKAQIYAWKKGIKTIYYIRLRQMALEGTEVQGCVSCSL